MNSLLEWKGFRWEGEDYWWEKLRVDELGLPYWLGPVLPDKLMHFLMTFTLCWVFSRWVHRYLAVFLGWFTFMVPWEIVWDGCFRYGASWRDMIANTLGALIALWWLGSRRNVGQTDDAPLE